MRLRNFWMLACMLFTSCGGSDDISVKAEASQLLITNSSAETAYFAAYPSNILAYITIVPACSEETAIAPGETRTITYETLLRTGQDDEAVVYWWRCAEGEQHTTIAKAHVIRIRL